MSKRTIDLSNVVKTHRDETDKTISALTGEVITVVVDAAEADEVDAITVRKLTEMRDVVTLIAHGSHTSAGRDKLLNGQPILPALGSGSSSGEADPADDKTSNGDLELLRNLVEYCGLNVQAFLVLFQQALQGTNQTEANHRLQAAMSVLGAKKGFELMPDGSLKVADDLKKRDAELATEKANAGTLNGSQLQRHADELRAEQDKTKSEKERADEAERKLNALQATPPVTDQSLNEMLDDIQAHGKFRFHNEDVLRIDFPALAENTQKRIAPK